MTKTLKHTTFGFLTIALMLMSITYFTYSPPHSDLKIEVATVNVTVPECNKHNRCAEINWDALQENIDGMTRSMEQPNSFNVKPLDYDALHKAGLWPR